MSNESVFNLGMVLINILEVVHEGGFVYNDLKLENILLSFGQKLPADCKRGNCFQDVSLTLVDFGFASQYMD